MSREPKEGRPYKNVDKHSIKKNHIMCWKCGEIVSDTDSVMRVGKELLSGCNDIDDLLCNQCDKIEYSMTKIEDE